MICCVGRGYFGFKLIPYSYMGYHTRLSFDAVCCFGYGAIFQCHWFSGSWSASQVPLFIAYKELFAVVVAAYLWDPTWAFRRVEFLCDNEAVVSNLNSGTSRDPHLKALLRYLSLLLMQYSFSFRSSVQGKNNPIADSLSLLQFQCFRRLASLANREVTPIPPSLLADLQVV